jgi:hypothetical protein
MDAKQAGYKIGENLRGDLRGMVSAYRHAINQSPGQKSDRIYIENRRERDGGVHLATYSTNGGVWFKGDTGYVHDHEIDENFQITPKYKADGTPQYTLVINLFSTLPPNYDAIRYCAYTKINAANVLIAAEC